MMNAPLISTKGMATGRRRDAAAIPPMPDYNARVLAYLAGAATVLSGIYADHFDSRLIWAVPLALLWPQLVFFITRYFRLQRNLATRQRVLLIDGALSGVMLNLIDFSIVPSLFVLLMLNFSFVIVGGIRTWLQGMLATAATATTTMLLTGLPSPGETPLSVSVIAGITAGIYVCVTAYYTHQQAVALVTAKSQIQYQREQSIALSHKLAKYLSPQVWQSIFTGERDVRLETQRKKLCVFFSDIRGFTELSEEMEPEGLTELLNNYFTEMSQIALKYGGTIDKFVGDSIMIFFGDPTSRGAKEDTLACAAMAIDMRKHMQILRQKWRSQGIRTPLEIRMGISTGFCTVGNFGADNRMDYTIIGKEVNLASRLESLAEPGEILVAYETFSLIKDKILCRDKGDITVKGFGRPVPIYEVVDFRRDIGNQRSFFEHEREGFAMYLDSDKISPSERESILAALDDAAQRLRNDG
jgi:adenylate cyclase